MFKRIVWKLEGECTCSCTKIDCSITKEWRPDGDTEEPDEPTLGTNNWVSLFHDVLKRRFYILDDVAYSR